MTSPKSNVPALLGPNGAPLPVGAGDFARFLANGGGQHIARARASLNGSAPEFFPYDAAQWTSPEFGDWLPWVRSPDTEINLHRDRMVARNRDVFRNDGLTSGGINLILDSTIGGDYQLVAEPDFEYLRLFARGFDDQWAEKFQDVIQAKWRNFADDEGRWCDVSGMMTITQMFRVALKHKLFDGESLILPFWLPERVGYGEASYSIAFQGVDPDRLSNPFQMVDTKHRRGGVQVDDNGRPLGYHIRKAHQNDWYNAVESVEWEYVPRYDPDGFRRVIHDHDADRFQQHRGVSILTPILARLKMLATYYGVKLQRATVMSVLGTYITSPLDQAMVEAALSGEGEGAGDGGLGFYQTLREGFHQKHALHLNNVRIPTLAPGEDIKSVSADGVEGDFSPFANEMKRTVAACLGMTASQFSRDYSDTNYSSERAGIAEAEKTYDRRCADFEKNTATPVYSAWLMEAIQDPEVREIMPRNAPDFLEARNAYSACYWIGAASGWTDPVAERQGEILGLDAGFSNLERVCAKQGSNWKTNLRKRARERRMMDELDLPHPQWMGEAMTVAETATKQTVKPKAA
jgi:lambda family phage portal protein